MSVREVQIVDYLDLVQPLLKANWDETGFDFEFAPEFDKYIKAQEVGYVIALGAFEGEELIGYSTAFMYPHHFNPAIIMCATDALYVAPEHRNGTVGARLIIETEKLAKERGANMISWHTRAGTPLAEVMTKRGYTPADTIVMRSL